jgi:hypothetical protein
MMSLNFDTLNRANCNVFIAYCDPGDRKNKSSPKAAFAVASAGGEKKIG